MRILLAEDEKDLSRALVTVLKMQNYSVDAVYDGQDALDFGLSENYDALILDIMMPKMDGITVLKRLRENGVTTPVMMLTAKAQVPDKILGLNSGADDYLPKPFAMAEFIARVAALTRRGAAYTHQDMAAGNITLSRDQFVLASGDASIRLSNKEYQMMEMLLRRRGQVIATEQFMERIWGQDSDAEIGVVWVYISYLRKKLSSLNANIEIIARRGQGYSLVERGDTDV